MSLKSERNIYIFLAFLLITFIEVTIMNIPYINIPLSIYCIYKAYKINKTIKDKNKCDIATDKNSEDTQY